jgi:hypothetical protein
MASNGDEPTALIPRKNLAQLLAESAPEERFDPPPTTWIVIAILAVLALLFVVIITHY